MQWVPVEEPVHSHLFTSIVRRHVAIGNLHERLSSLEKVYRQVLGENVSLQEELSRLRAMLEGGSQQEEIAKQTMARERDMRRAAEKERSMVQLHKEELEGELERARQHIAQLQLLLQQAVVSAQQGAEGPQSSFYSSSYSIPLGRVGV